MGRYGFRKNNRAVSEVLGVILMVVIVTILASITALFVYVYLQTVSQPYMVEFTPTRLTPQTIEITNNGGPGDASLDTSIPNYITVSVNGQNGMPVAGGLTFSIGSSAVYDANYGAHLTIRGFFKDGHERTLYDGTLS
jgi:hypothetical protein